MEANASFHAFHHGVDRTRVTLSAWRHRPLPVIGGWLAGSTVAAIGLLTAVLLISVLSSSDAQIIQLRPPFEVGDLNNVIEVLLRNLLVLALHAMACLAGLIAGSSLPMQANEKTGASRWVHEHGGRIAITFVVCATAFSLSIQAYVLGNTLAGVAHFLEVSPALLLLGALPHAIPELVGLFLPLAAWIISSRRGEWDQLLAAAIATVTIALPVLVIAAFIEVYISPHLFTTLTNIHPPIVRTWEGVSVRVGG